MVCARVFCLLSLMAKITDYSLSLTRPQSSLLVLLLLTKDGASVGGDGKKERRETSSLVFSPPIMPSRAFFPGEDDWGRVSLCLITKLPSQFAEQFTIMAPIG